VKSALAWLLICTATLAATSKQDLLTDVDPVQIETWEWRLD
jgi:hypothetical protein